MERKRGRKNKSIRRKSLSRILAILLATSTLFGLTACGENEDTASRQSTSSQEVSSSQQSKESSQPEPVESAQSKVTKEEWQEAYQEVLLKQSTYGKLSDGGVAYIFDLDNNGVPELYIATVEGRAQQLLGLYDFSSGIMDTNIDIDIPFSPNIATHKTTGERVLFGATGGPSMWDEYILIPKEGRLDFTQEILCHASRDFEGGIDREPVSKKYKEADFDIQYTGNDRSLPVTNKVPEEQEIRDLLDIRFMNPGGFEKCMDNGEVKLLLTDPISNFINKVQEINRNDFSIDQIYLYKINDFQADKNTWGLELVDICSRDIKCEIVADEMKDMVYTAIYPSDQVDAFTQSLYGFTMDKGENYQNGKYVIPDKVGFYGGDYWLQDIPHVMYVDKELQMYYIEFDIGYYIYVNGTDQKELSRYGNAVIQLVDTEAGKQIRIYEIGIGNSHNGDYSFKPYIEMAKNEFK